jgi:hemerythrin
MEPKPDPADSRRQILAEHQQITALTQQLATVQGAPEMATCLRKLATILTDHFRQEEEGFDGLHESIRARTPELQNALQGLKDEHQQLLDRLQLLLSIVQESRGSAPKLQLLGKQLQERLSEHEAKETRIFLDSIWADLGEGD